MVFNDTTNLEGLIQHCEFLVFGGDYGRISGNTDRLKEFTRLINNAQDWSAQYILQSDFSWRFQEDSLDQTLSDGVSEYEILDDTPVLKVIAVEVLDSDSKWRRLTNIDLSQIDGAPSEYLSTSTSCPSQYDLFGNTIKLYPTPTTDSCTLTNGLRIHYQTKPTAFTSSDTTAKSELPGLFDEIIALRACLQYAKSQKMTQQITTFTNDLTEQLDSLQDFMNDRATEYKQKMRVRRYATK